MVKTINKEFTEYEDCLNFILETFKNNKDVSVYCNYEMAKYLTDFLQDEIENSDYESIQYDTETDEYYVARVDDSIFCEYAKNEDDNYLENYAEIAIAVNGNDKLFNTWDIENELYIVNLNIKEQNEENTITIGIDFANDETDNTNEEEVDDSYVEIDRIVNEMVAKISGLVCPHCIKEELVDLWNKAYSTGIDDMKHNLVKLLSDEEE